MGKFANIIRVVLIHYEPTKQICLKTESEIIKLIRKEVIPSKIANYSLWNKCINEMKQNLTKLKNEQHS